MDAGKIRMTLDRKYLNGLCSILTLFAEDEETNGYDNFAKYMLDKIKRYGRKFTNKNGKEKMIVYLYNNEAELLVQMMAICITAVSDPKEDYYEQIGVGRDTEYRKHQEEREQKLNEMFS